MHPICYRKGTPEDDSAIATHNAMVLEPKWFQLKLRTLANPLGAE